MKKLIMLVGLVFLMSFVSAQPSFTTINFEFDDGLIIVDSPQTYLKQGQNYTINFFVYNKTSGALLDNSTINCTYYLDNNLGELIHSSLVEYNPREYWNEFISESNFTRIGEYNYGIRCLSGSEDIGGTTVGTLIVTSTGKLFSTADVIGALAVLFGALLVASLFMWLGFKLGENDKTMPFGFLLISISIILVLYSLFLGYTFSQNIIEFEAMTNLAQTIFLAILWMVVGLFVLFMAMMLIAFIRELGKMGKTKKFGQDFNPITNTYE